ncbi:hypothetical protein OSTOST_08109 [Ostertagia ostertagi]
MTQVICHDLNEVWDDISEFLDQENFRIGEVSRLAFSPLETPTVGMLTRAPRVHDQLIREPPITLAMPPPALPGATFAPAVTPNRLPAFASTCALAAAAIATSAGGACSAQPTTSTVIPSYYPPPPQPSVAPPQPQQPPPLPIKEESPPSSPEIPYPYIDATYSRSPLANSLPDLNLPNPTKSQDKQVSEFSKNFAFLL